MRPLRAILRIVKGEPPIPIAKECVWRAWKPIRKKHLMELAARGICPLSFRNVPYFRPETSLVGDRARTIITGISDKVCSGRVPFLGYATADWGVKPAWNCDFVSGKRWRKLEYQKVVTVRHDGSDVKVPWDLSRLQLLPVLAKAHLLAKDERYRNTAKHLIWDWIEQNPFGVGVNWTLAMESALRAISMCLTINLLWPLREDERDWLNGVTKAIWQHMLYTEANLEYSNLMRSNHYLSNAVGLFCMCVFLDGQGMAGRRRRYARVIEREMAAQVYGDGGDYEASLGYHVLATQLFTSAFLLMRAVGITPSASYEERLRRMYSLIDALADCEGRLPHVGDCDDGRVELTLDDLEQMLSMPVEKRHTLRVSNLIGLGDALFGETTRGDVTDAAWYGLNAGGNHAARKSCIRVFPHSGLAIARKDATEVILCAIPNGIHGNGSHTHNDKLSIIARLGGAELFCDSGVLFYTRDASMRNMYRSTSAHNTIMVDGLEQNVINLDKKFLFCIGNDAQVSNIEVKEADNESLLSASHSGYKRIGVLHRRTVRVRAGDEFVIEDELQGEGTHEFQSSFHLPSGWCVDARSHDDKRIELRITGKRKVRMTVQADCELRVEVVPVKISRMYGGAAEAGTKLSLCGCAIWPMVLETRVHWEG